MTAKTLVKVIVWLLILNCASFTIARLVIYRNGGLAAELRVTRADKTRGVINFLIAGNLNQPQAAFEFLEGELHGLVVYADFRMIGWDPKATADNIVRTILHYSCPEHTKIWTISLGDHVARYIEDWPGSEIEMIAINPCTDVSFLRQPLGTVMKVGAPVFEVVCHGLGWLSVIPIIPTAGGRYSLILLADQYWSIAYDKPPAKTRETVGVICSRLDGDDHDGLLDNERIREYFREHHEKTWRPVQIVDIATGHGDTIGAADIYLSGVKQIYLRYE